MAEGHDRETGRERRPDPTRMAEQPALQTSSGLVWLVVGALFAAVSLVPLGALILVSPGRSLPVAVTTAALVVLLYGLMIAVRLATPRGPRRLRRMAACLLAMAGFALLGIWICALVEGAPA